MDDPKRRQVKKDDDTCRWKQYGKGKATSTAMDVSHSVRTSKAVARTVGWKRNARLGTPNTQHVGCGELCFMLFFT